MRRREVVLAGVGATAWPLIARAQRAKRVGVVLHGGRQLAAVAGLRETIAASGLAGVGVIVREGKGDLRGIEAAAKELESDGVDVLVSLSASVSVAAKRATSRVPLVFVSGSDPVAFGLVDSIARPGGRVTGVQSLFSDITSKRLALLREMLPQARRVLTYYNPGNVTAAHAVTAASDAAGVLGFEYVARPTNSPDEVQARVAALAAEQADAFFFVPDSLIGAHDQLLLDAAGAIGLPCMTHELDMITRGAVAGYGNSYRELGRQAGELVTRILAGAAPSDVPVQSVTKVVLAINLQTARALSLTIPASLLARADEVIE